ncbi:hypothetical protein J2Y58_003506 [Sphingomonas sp. BE138]|uniref:hypothetical protein n=1 Tax=Sphingomonas sp. BE138 TaxID=2817845 RepID=UPI002862FF34|nr:hypothetical protein [Sphingomonas sp. BE138]MDR6790126.1 hypothetical protein [Sphingomonas sp. BE138]
MQIDRSGDAVTIARYERLLAEHLIFYDALRLRERRPRSAAQRQFQDVAWGKAEPVSEHELAYVWYLTQRRIAPFGRHAPAPHIDDTLAAYEAGARPVSGEIGTKWDNAWREYRGGREFW